VQDLVSILVLLDVALKEPGGRGQVPIDPVSILVLLDVALKEGVCSGRRPAHRRFQSLFSWMLL